MNRNLSFLQKTGTPAFRGDLLCSAVSSHFSEWVEFGVLSTSCSVLPFSVAHGKMFESALLRNNSINWLNFISNFDVDNHFYFRNYLTAWLRESHRNVRANPTISLKCFSLFICILNIKGHFKKCYRFPWKSFFPECFVLLWNSSVSLVRLELKIYF